MRIREATAAYEVPATIPSYCSETLADTNQVTTSDSALASDTDQENRIDEPPLLS
jgi:hypothetical protein